MPSPLCKGWNVRLLESFQLFNELFCILNCDKLNLKPANWLKVALTFFLFVCLFLSDLLYHDISFSVVWDDFFFACILTHALILPGIPYRSAVISLTTILPERPICTCLKSQLNAPFMWKKRFFFKLPYIVCFHAVHLFLIQLKLNIEKFVYSFCSAESH